MVLDERSRHAMFTRLQEVLGEEQATVLMEHLPPVGWADVATKHDIDALRVATKHDIDTLRVATKHDIDTLRVATKRDIDALRASVSKDLEVVESRVLGKLHYELSAQTRIFVTWLVAATSASTVTVAALAFAAARLV